MTYLLILLFLSLLGFVVYLYFKIDTERKKFDDKIALLKEVIFQLNREQKRQNNQLILSDSLKQKIILINQTMSQNIYDLNFDLFEENYPKRTN